MGSLSDYYENKVLDHINGKTALSLVTPVYFALLTVVPTDASTGATITEANFTGYARKAIAAADWNAAAAGAATNANALVFADCTAGSSTVVAFAILDAGTIGAGNIIYWGTIPSTVISTTYTPPTVPIGALSTTID